MTHQDPLPRSFESELFRVDRAVARATADLRPPAGLADRIFEASRADLAPPKRTWATRLVGAGQRIGWSELGLAASLGITIGLGTMFMSGGPDSNSATVVLASETSWLELEPTSVDDQHVAHILDTGDMGSHFELTQELELLVSDLETDALLR